MLRCTADVADGSSTASPIAGWRGSYTPDNGLDGGRPARPRWANIDLLHRKLAANETCQSREDALTIVTNVTDQPLFGQEDCPISPQLSDAVL